MWQQRGQQKEDDHVLEQEGQEEELPTEQLDLVVNDDMTQQLRPEQQEGEGEGEGEQMWRQQRGQQESYVVQDLP